MTKADLARAVYDRHGGITTREAVALIDLILDTIKKRLVLGDLVYLVGIGKMEIVPRLTQRGRKPASGNASKRVILYRPAGSLR